MHRRKQKIVWYPEIDFQIMIIVFHFSNFLTLLNSRLYFAEFQDSEN